MCFSQEKLEALKLPDGISAAELAALLSQFEYDRRTVCNTVVSALRPLLNRLAEEPKEGWLPALYAALLHGLFPDPNYTPQAPAIQDALVTLTTLLEALFTAEDAPFDPLTDRIAFDEALLETSRVQKEYQLFQAAIQNTHFVTMMRIGRELLPFDPASHTIGVHNIATHTAIIAKTAGLPVDVPLVSAAALCHDIGKFACRGADAKRIPYLHYYYTWQWLSSRGMDHIAHISANHSTWDLEFENLPIESLLLIYSDFRVRGTWENGRETVRIYSLADAYEMILSKLCDVTPEKQRRYETAYSKLHDFERFLHSCGVGTELHCDAPEATQETNNALLSSEEALNALRNMTFDHNARLMHTISTDSSFDQLLEQARAEKNTYRIRTYLQLFDEYHPYMSSANKRKLLSFLYELFMYPEGDVRRVAGNIMGRVLANSGPKYRKELPYAAPKSATAPTMLSLLDESVSLWDNYVELCLHPDHKIAAKHALRISNSLKAVCETLFAESEPQAAAQLVQPLLRRLPLVPETDCFVLLDALCHVPPTAVSEEDFLTAAPYFQHMLDSGTPRWQLIALRCIAHLRSRVPDSFLLSSAQPLPDDVQSVVYLRHKLWGSAPLQLSEQDASLIYLSNLKNAVHWSVKNAQIDMLCDDISQHMGNAFHTAMHLSNLLSVSEHLPVREHAGKALLSIAGCLTIDQRNEIAVDLMRELENGQEQIARFIPSYLGRLLSTLPEKELWEAIDFLETLLRSGTVRPAGPVLRTLGSLVAALPDSDSLIDYCLGLLMTGVAHYEPSIHRSALSVLCHDVIANNTLPVKLRCRCFTRICKKLFLLLSEPSRGKLIFFNRAAMLNHLYRFVIQYEVERGSFNFPVPKPVAFFPGSFDPFSAGHKRIVQEIRTRGFEVYLAVDEFSWSKRTLAKLLRRKIVNMSVADQWDTYVFPDHIPINIAIPEDLANLRNCFPCRQIYLVTGSDVIQNASAYRTNAVGCAAEFDHIIVHRPTSNNPDFIASKHIQGNVIEISLPPQLEAISSTYIRESIDKNLDISMLVDPIVQAYIYEYGLYLRSPQLKNVLSPQELYFRQLHGNEPAPPELFEFLRSTASPIAVALCARSNERFVGWACGHTVAISALYDELHSIEAASAVRRHTAGRLLMIDRFYCEAGAPKETPRLLLNELLARSLQDDHTYALCRCTDENTVLHDILLQLGFIPVDGTEALYYVDMRAPMILIQDVLLCIKKPYHEATSVVDSVKRARPRLRSALTQLYPGKLLLCFDAEMLNQSLMFMVQQLGGVTGMKDGEKHLGSFMCVPYGKILSDEIVPNTVTKTLHVDKTFAPDGSSFTVPEYPGYDSLQNQVRTIKAFRRPVILVDDLLHKGYRINKLNPIFEKEHLEIGRIVVGILSARGRDLMQMQHRSVDCEYFIPNLHYWVTESSLYPFLGGDSIGDRNTHGRMLPSINLILPYYYPRHFVGTTDTAIRHLSRTVLENALSILRTLEAEHQRSFNTALTLQRLGEALYRPRLPDRGNYIKYDFSLSASVYLEDDLLQLDRIRMRGGAINGI